MSAGRLARWGGSVVPFATVAAVLIVLMLLAQTVDLDRALVPKPSFKELAIKGYPADTPLADGAAIVDAVLWWLCLSLVLWVVGLATLGLCGWQLHSATRHDGVLARIALRVFLAVAAGAIAVLVYVAGIRNVPLFSLGPMVDNLAMVSSGFMRLGTFNAALAFVVGLLLLLAIALLLLPGAYADDPSQQMRAITRIMYGGAAFLFVWISAATGMYRLAALLLVPAAREPILKLAPTVSLMGGLFLTLLWAAAYLSACVWLQHCHDAKGIPRKQAKAAADAASPSALLLAHWPKFVAILLPLLPGAAGSVLQALVHAP